MSEDGIQLSLDQLLQCHRLGSLLAARFGGGLRLGQHRSRGKGRGMEFAEVRPYQQGDDVRTIDWRITARTGRTHTKLFREERDRAVYLLVDFSPEMYFGSRGQLKARLACELAAALAWQAQHNGDKIGGLLLVEQSRIRMAPGGNRKDVLILLNKLLNAYQQGLSRPPLATPLEQGLAQLNLIVRPGSQIQVISDFYRLGNEGWHWLRRLNRQHEVRCWQVRDQLELQLQGQGYLAVDNLRQQGVINANHPQFVRHYQQVGHFRQQQLRLQLRSSCHQLFELDASEPLPNQLRGL